MTNPSKSGFKTSEFWVSLLAMGLTYLASQGVIASSQINPLLNAFMQVYSGALALLTIFGIARSYIQSRTAVKKTILETQQNTPLTSV